jgi:hypothetical protein
MDQSTVIRRVVVVAMVVLGLVVPATASATGKTVQTTVHIPATVLNNLCYGAEPVALSGDLRITETTTPDSRGGYTVRSSSRANNLQGQGLVSLYGYDGEDSYSYYAPPPYPSTQRVTHYTRLVPKGPIPSMYLVTEFRQTVLGDGTAVPTLDRTYLTCRGAKR